MLPLRKSPEKEIQIKFREVKNNPRELNRISSEKANRKLAIS